MKAIRRCYTSNSANETIRKAFVYKSKDAEEQRHDWDRYSAIILQEWMEHPWFKDVFPEQEVRRKHIRKNCHEFYEKKISKGKANFVTFQVENEIVGGQTLDYQVDLKQEYTTTNTPSRYERSLKLSDERVVAPLKSYADFLQTELWYFGKHVVGRKWQKHGLARYLVDDTTRILNNSRLQGYNASGKTLSNPPLVYFITTETRLKEYYTGLGYTRIASVPCPVEGIEDNTNHVFLLSSSHEYGMIRNGAFI